MEMIIPKTTTDATFNSSNVVETDETEWNGTVASYSTDDYVMVTTTDVHRVYQAIVDITGSGGNLSPEVDVLEPIPKWIETSSTNRWRMFHPEGGEQTSRLDNITVEIETGTIINSVALLDLDAHTVQVIMTDPFAGIVYDNTIDLVTGSGITNWYNYYFDPITRLSDVVLLDLPPYSAAVVKIIISSNATTIARCGIAMLGNFKYLGLTQYGASLGISDYSIKTVDDFGRSTITKRSFVKNMSVDIVLQSGMTDDVHKTLSENRATPLVWIGSDLYTSTIIYGYFRDFDVVIANNAQSECSIEIEGLV